jgi:phosphonate transport system permease protein
MSARPEALRAEARAELARLRARYPAQFRTDWPARARLAGLLAVLCGVVAFG